MIAKQNFLIVIRDAPETQYACSSGWNRNFLETWNFPQITNYETRRGKCRQVP